MYRKLIEELLDQIDDEGAFKRIYRFVQQVWLHW